MFVMMSWVSFFVPPVTDDDDNADDVNDDGADDGDDDNADGDADDVADDKNVVIYVSLVILC